MYFTQEELLIIAEEITPADDKLGQLFIKRTRDADKLKKYIARRIHKYEPDTMSELANEFLTDMRFPVTDVDRSDEEEVLAELREADKIGDDTTELPPCWPFGDPVDVACQKCPFIHHCVAKRASRVPPCFGDAYDRHNELCTTCFEAPWCKRNEMPRLQDIPMLTLEASN